MMPGIIYDLSFYFLGNMAEQDKDHVVLDQLNTGMVSLNPT
jgi:hypothetical protein